MSIRDQIPNAGNVDKKIDPTYQPANFDFTPIEDIVDLDFDVESTQGMGDYMKSLNVLAPKVNQIAAPAVISGFPNTGAAYKPDQDFDSFQGFSDTFNSPDPFLSGMGKKETIADPIISGSRSSGYDRIAAHPDFPKLGWNPTIDNESYYNKNTDWYTDYQRAGTFFLDSAGAGFFSSYRSIGDFFDSDSYLASGDFESGLAFAEATRMGSSTRGGTTQFGANLFLQFGYTAGIMSNIIAEELALAAATAATEGGTLPVFMARTGANFVRGIRSIGDAFDITRTIKTSKSILDTLRNANRASDFYNIAKTGGKIVGDILTPELRATIKELKTAENSVRGLDVLAKRSTYGAFYRDLRSMNFAMSEGKMEAALVYTDIFNENMGRLIRENAGENPTPEQLREVNDAALKAATWTIAFNSPVIFATNKILLGNALGGFSPMFRRIFNKNLPKFANNFRKTKKVIQETGEVAKDLYVNTAGEKTLLGKVFRTGRLKGIGAMGVVRGTANGLLRYSAASLGEGLQEVYQEGIAVGVVDYYTKLLEDPSAHETDLFYTAVQSGVASQMSAQGAEVFMSGFLMGGLASGPQRLLFEVIPEVIQRKRNPEAFEKYEQNLAEFEKQINAIGNSIQENPFDYFSPTRLNFFQTVDASNEVQRNLYDGDPMGLMDAKDMLKFQHMHFHAKSGTKDLFIEQFEDFLQLSDEQLAEAFPQHKEDIESGKARERLQKSITDMKNFESEYNASFDLIVNPYNPSQYSRENYIAGKKAKTDEEKKVAEVERTRLYNQEKIKHDAVEHARMLYLLSKDSVKRAISRRDNIEKSLQASGILEELSANDLTVLLSADSIQQETKMLLQELIVLQQAENPDIDLIKSKQNRLAALEEYERKLESIYDQNAKLYDRERRARLKKPLKDYLEVLADGKNDFVKLDMLDQVVLDLIDHNNLDRRAQIYDRSVALFSDPAKVTDLIDRINQNLKVLFDRAKSLYEKNVKAAIQDAEAKQLLDGLITLGVYPDTTQAIQFLQSGDVADLKDFYHPDGLINKTVTTEVWEKIESLKQQYTDAKSALEKTQEEEFEVTPKEEKGIDDSKFDNLEFKLPTEVADKVDDVIDETDILLKDQSPYAQQILRRLYAKYRIESLGSQIAEDRAYKSIQEWVNSKEGTAAIKTLVLLKNWWLTTIPKDLSEEERMRIKQQGIGFKEWLNDNLENPDINKMLESAGISVNMVSGIPTKALDEIVGSEGRELFIAEPGVNIIKIQGEEEVRYEIRDNEGNLIREEFFDKAGLPSARSTYLGSEKNVMITLKNIAQALSKVMPSDSSYKIGDMELDMLDELEDIEGNKFVFIGTQESKAIILPYDKRGAVGADRDMATIYVPNSELSKRFTKIEESFEGVTFTENMAKINPKDIVGLYPKDYAREEDRRKLGIKRRYFEQRTQRMFEMLTPEERGNITITIKRNERDEPVKFSYGDSVPPNPLINKLGDKYTIEIKVDPATANRLVADLKETTYRLPEDFDGVIGFIQNDHFNYTDLNDPRRTGLRLSDLEDEVIERYISQDNYTAEEMKAADERQQALTVELDKLMTEDEKLVHEREFSINDFVNSTGFDFVVTDGALNFYPEFNLSPRDLDYYTFDGEVIVMDNRKLKGKDLDAAFFTNLEGTEHTAFTKKVVAELEKQGLYDRFTKSDHRSRYVLLIRQHGGAITGLQLRQKVLSDQSRQELYEELIKTAQEYRKSPVTGTTKTTWQRNFNNKFYPALQPIAGGRVFLDFFIGRTKVDNAFVDGDIGLRYNQDGKKYSVTFSSEQLEELANDPMKLDELFEMLNEKIKDDNTVVQKKFSPNMLRAVFSMTTPADTVLDNTTTNSDPRVRIGRRTYLDTKSANPSAQRAARTTVSNPQGTGYTPIVDVNNVSDDKLEELATIVESGGVPGSIEDSEILSHRRADIDKIIANRQKAESLKVIASAASISELSDEEYAEYKKNGFSELPQSITGGIANKVINQGRESLSEKEEEVLKARQDIEALIGTTQPQLSESDKELQKAETELKEVEDRMKVIDAEIVDFVRKNGGNRFRLRSQNKEYVELQKRLNQIKNDVNNGNSAYKIIDPTMALGEEYSLQSFVNWTKQNLPEFITIGDINDLESRLKANGLAVGVFSMQLKDLAGKLEVEGRIYTGATNSYRYHEAFHSVFRMLLTDEEQTKLRRLAKAEVRKKFATRQDYLDALNTFRNSHPKYKRMSAQELENEYLEEYMADEFEKFKTNPRSTKTNSAIKSFFTRLLEYIRLMLKGFKGNELKNLFEAIDAGRYKGGNVQSNVYTRALYDGTTIDAYKLIPFEEYRGSRTFEYLDSNAADMLVRMIGYTYMERRSLPEFGDLTDYVLIQQTISDYAELYNPASSAYDGPEVDIDRVERVQKALTLNDGDAVVSAVQQYLDILNLKIETEQDDIDSLEDEVGSRKVGDYTKSANQIGGISSVSRRVRLFIASIALESKDMFGNTQLLNGEKIRVPVKHVDVYNLFMKAGQNKFTDDREVLRALYFHSRQNRNAAAVVDELFARTGIRAEVVREDKEEVINIEFPEGGVTQSQLLQDILKTFKNSSFDYIHQMVNIDKPSEILHFSASGSDAANAQIDTWQKDFGNKFELFRSNKVKIREATEPVEALVSLFSGTTKMTDKKLMQESKIIAEQLFENLGIKLSPLYIKLSLIKERPLVTNFHKEQLATLGAGIRLMSSEDANIMMSLLKKTKDGAPNPDNLFIDNDGSGMTSRLKSIAQGNANFDETIGNTVHVDSENNLIYSHQKSTYHSRRAGELSVADLDRLEELENNMLLKDPVFRKILADGQFKIVRPSGISEGKVKGVDNDASVIQDFSSSSGTNYGSFTTVQFMTSMINYYTAKYNTTSGKNTVVEAEGQAAALAPVLIRIMESANNGDQVNLPVIEAIKDGQLTEDALTRFSTIIETEYDRMRQNFKDGLGTIINFNDTDSGNAFKFWNGRTLIDAELQADLVEKASNDQALTKEDFSKIEKSIAEVAKADLDFIVDLLREEGIINKLSGFITGTGFPITEEGIAAREGLNLLAIDQTLQDKNARDENMEMVLTHNIHQIYLNNLLNTIAVNELFLGDESRIFKEPIVDPIKRGKMQNAAHDSVAFDLIPNASEGLGIEFALGDESIALALVEDDLFEQRYTPGRVPGNREGEKTDAQTFMTAKGIRYTEYGLGGLNKGLARLINDIEDDKKVVGPGWFKSMKKDNAVLNSRKFVHGDGQTFMKMSTVPVTKEETSEYIRKTGQLLPKEGMEQLHYLRENMEAFEEANPGKIIIVAPKSAVKMFKDKLNTLGEITSFRETPITLDDVTLLDAKNFGRQLINPSNKLEMTQATQLKGLITSEHDLKQSVVINGETLSLKDVIETYHQMNAAGVRFDYNQKERLLFDLLPQMELDILDEIKDDVEPDLLMFLRQAVMNLKSSAASSNTIEFFQEQLGKARYELNNPLTSDKFEQFFMAYFSKKVLARKRAGLSLALRSPFGKTIIRRVYSLDRDGIGKHDVIRRKQWERTDRDKRPELLDIRNEAGFSELRSRLANNPKEGVLVIDRVRFNMMEYDKTNSNWKKWKPTKIRYAEAIVPAHHQEVMELIENQDVPIPDIIAKMFAVRIPSQDKHSGMGVKLVDFDPAYLGSTAVFAEELIEVSGADFDIDKVYAAIKEWYVSEGKFIEYGSRIGKEGFDDYTHYVNQQVRKKGSIFHSAYEKHLGDQTFIDNYNLEMMLADVLQDISGGLTIEAKTALEVLKLPTTQQDFETYIRTRKSQPYTAAINNKILDMEFALMGNLGMTENRGLQTEPIAYQPADIEALKAEWRTISTQFPWLADLTRETGININSLIGQFYSHKNAKENGNMIGAVVPPNVIINFLKERGVTMRKDFAEIKVDGRDVIKFEDFEGGVELAGAFRAQYLISNLITAATDDAKERILAKLGYVKKAIKLVEVMLSMGVKLHTATLLINVPEFRQMLKDPLGFNKDLGAYIAAGTEKLKDYKLEKLPPVDITADVIASHIQEKEELERLREESATTPEFIAADQRDTIVGLNLAYLLSNFNILSQFIDSAIPIFNLNKGFGQDFSALRDRQESIDALGLYLDDQGFKEHTFKGRALPFDMRDAFGVNTKADEKMPHFIGEYLKINKRFTTQVLPKVFLSYTPTFLNMTKAVFDFASLDSASKSRVNKDLLAYITIKAYMKQLAENEEATTAIGGSLSNDFIYPSDSDNNVVNVIKNLKNNPKTRDNYYLNYYLTGLTANDEKNKTGLNIATTNTFGRRSDEEAIRIQNGAQALYVDKDTRRDAMHIIHFTMVKDGLSFTYGSIMDSITPYGLDSYLRAAGKAFDAFRGKLSFEEVFGLTQRELVTEFIQNYPKSVSFADSITRSLPKKGYNVETDTDKGEVTYTLDTAQKKNKPKEFPMYYQQEALFGPPVFYVMTEASMSLGDGPAVDTFDPTQGKIPGSRFKYKRFEPMGAYTQTAIGFMFGDRPSFDQFRLPKTGSANVPGDPQNYRQEDFEGYSLDQRENLNKLDIIATDKGVEYERPAGVKDGTETLMKFFAAKDAGQPTQQQAGEVKSIKMQPDNIAKILSGEKTTTLRTSNIPSGVYDIGGSLFNLTNRGLLSIEEAGGVEAISESEAFAETGPKFSSTKDFLEGKRKLYVIDITKSDAKTSKEVEITPNVSEFSQLKLDLDSTQSDEFTEALKDLEQKATEIGLPKSVIDNMRTQYGVDMRSSEGLRKSFEDSKFRTLKEYIDHVKECIMPPF